MCVWSRGLSPCPPHTCIWEYRGQETALEMLKGDEGVPTAALPGRLYWVQPAVAPPAKAGPPTRTPTSALLTLGHWSHQSPLQLVF